MVAGGIRLELVDGRVCWSPLLLADDELTEVETEVTGR